VRARLIIGGMLSVSSPHTHTSIYHIAYIEHVTRSPLPAAMKVPLWTCDDERRCNTKRTSYREESIHRDGMLAWGKRRRI